MFKKHIYWLKTWQKNMVEMNCLEYVVINNRPFYVSILFIIFWRDNYEYQDVAFGIWSSKCEGIVVKKLKGIFFVVSFCFESRCVCCQLVWRNVVSKGNVGSKFIINRWGGSLLTSWLCPIAQMWWVCKNKNMAVDGDVGRLSRLVLIRSFCSSVIVGIST